MFGFGSDKPQSWEELKLRARQRCCCWHKNLEKAAENVAHSVHSWVAREWRLSSGWGTLLMVKVNQKWRFSQEMLHLGKQRVRTGQGEGCRHHHFVHQEVTSTVQTCRKKKDLIKCKTWVKVKQIHGWKMRSSTDIFFFFPFSCHTGRLLRSHFLNQGLNPGHDSESTEPSPLGRQGTPCFLIFSFLPLLGAQLVKNLPAMWETWVWALGWEDPLEKGKAAHSRIPWTV